MLPLPAAEWYKRYPKPFSKAGNIDTAICQQGLRLSEKDEETLLNDVSEAMRNNGVPFGDYVGLKGRELKSKVKAVLHALSGKVGPRYGWHEIDEIDARIVPDYLFELAKKFHNNLKRRVPSHQGLNTPTALGDSAPAPNMNAGQGHPLHACDICVARVDTGEDYEDTIDVFLKSESRNSAAELGPNDYDFTLLKKKLTEALSYTEELEIISYSHAQKGEVEVDCDSKWRIALKYLSSQPSSQATLNFKLTRKAASGRLGDRTPIRPAAHSSKASSKPCPDESSNPPQSHPAPTPKQKSHFALRDRSKLPSSAQLSAQFAEPLLRDPGTRPAISMAQPPTFYKIESSPNGPTQPPRSSLMQPLPDLPVKPQTPLLGLPAGRGGTLCVNYPKLGNRDARTASAIQPHSGGPARETIVPQRNPLQSQKRGPPAPLLDHTPKRPKDETRSTVIVISSDEDDSDSEPVTQYLPLPNTLYNSLSRI